MTTGIITHEFMPGEDVWVIYNQVGEISKSSFSRGGCPPRLDGSGIYEGKTVYYRADRLLTQLKEWYGVNLKGSDSTRDFNVLDVFPTHTHALVEYENRLVGSDVQNSIRINQMVYESESANTTHLVTHGFGIEDVGVEVYDASNHKIVPNSVILYDANNVIVEFNDPQDCKVIVVGEKDYSKEILNEVNNTRVRQYVYDAKRPNTIHNINHGFGMSSVSVSVYNSDGYELVASEVYIVDDNNVRVSFGVEPKLCKVVVIGEVDYG